MKLIVLIAFLALFCFGNTFRVLRGQQIPQDYPIGAFEIFTFGMDGRIFFSTEDNVLGFINSKVGKITTLYLLDQGQSIVDFRGEDDIAISKAKSINLFSAREQKYVRMKFSDFLESQQFKKILTVRRFFHYDFVLTDTFVLRGRNPYAYRQEEQRNAEEKIEILAKVEQGEQFHSFVYLGNSDEKKIGLGVVSLTLDKKKLLVRIFYVDGSNSEKLSYDLDPTLTLQNIMEMGGDFIIVAYREKRVILDTRLNHVRQTKQEQMITFVDELNVIAPNSGKNLVADGGAKNLAFFDMANPRGVNYVQINQKYMLVKMNNKVIVNIPKKQQEKPVKIWAHTFEPNSKSFWMILELENGSLKVYNIDREKNEYKDLWFMAINKFKPMEGGEVLTPVELGLKEEEKIIEEGEKDDIGEQKQPISNGELPTEVQKPTDIQPQPPLIGNQGSGETQQPPKIDDEGSGEEQKPPLLGDEGAGEQKKAQKQEQQDLNQNSVDQNQTPESTPQEQQPYRDPSDPANAQSEAPKGHTHEPNEEEQNSQNEQNNSEPQQDASNTDSGNN